MTSEGRRQRPARLDSPEWWEHARLLASKVVAGDEEAAGELSGHVRPWVLRLAGRQFPFRGDAEDVTQNVCIVVLRNVGNLRDASRLRSWLAAVTLNEVRGFYRRQTQEAERLRRAAGSRPVDGVAAERTSLIGGLRVDLLDGLDHLPRHQAFALGLRQFGIGYDEIASELSQPNRLAELFDDRRGPVPVGSVKRWVSEARNELASAMAFDEGD